MKKIFIFLIFSLVILSTSVLADDNVPVYRIYNTKSGEHLYTTDSNEVSQLTEDYSSDWKDEDLGWVAPKSGQAVYRLYNNKNNSHLYTTDTNEISVLTSTSDWNVDNNNQPLFFSSGNVPVYRVFYPSSGEHHLTTDLNEYNTLSNSGWNPEGVSLYGAGLTYADIFIIDNVLGNPQSGWSQLNETEKEVYGKMYIGVKELKKDIDIRKYQIPDNEFTKIRECFHKDQMANFIQLTIFQGWGLDYTESYVTEFRPSYYSNLDEITEKLNRWDEEGLSRINPDMSEVEKAQILLNYLCEKVSYDNENPNILSRGQTIANVMQTDRALCAGYSRLFQHLLNKAGIFCTYYTGTANGGGHAWNLVCLDGEYGWADATWDDVGDHSDNDYLGLSTQDILKSRSFDRDQVYEDYPTPSWKAKIK